MTARWFIDLTRNQIWLDTSGTTFEEDEQWLRQRYSVVAVDWDVATPSGGVYTILHLAPPAPEVSN